MDSKRKPTKKGRKKVASELSNELSAPIDSEDEDLTKKVLEHLPNLAAEVQNSSADVRIAGVRWEDTDRTQQPITPGKPRFSGYSPDVVDFLRRCTTKEEALEIIEFLKQRGEINATHARELRKQLDTKGVRSFGSKKSWGHYEREDP